VKEIALEQSRLLRRDEALEVMSLIDGVPLLSRPRIIKQHGLYWEGSFFSDLPIRTWSADAFGDAPSFAVSVRLFLVTPTEAMEP
jgi:hypothetical protein